MWIMCIPEFLKRQGWDILILTIIRWRQDRTGKKENSRRVQPRRDFHRVEASRDERRSIQGNRGSLSLSPQGGEMERDPLLP